GTSQDNVASCDGTYHMFMQKDGNLVVYNSTAPVWASNTMGSFGGTAVMQADGNLVVYTATGVAVWSSNTAGNPGAFFVLDTLGRAFVYSTAVNDWIWSSVSPAAPANCGVMAAPFEGLWQGMSLYSCDGKYNLAMQADGNLVLYNDFGGGTSP